MKGIDVSQWQGEIDWATVKAAGVEFALIRAGLRGYAPEGKLAEDARFRENAEGAIAAGIPVGVYFFSQATTPEEGREEARYCLELVRPYKLDFPVYIDSEYANAQRTGRADGLSKEARTAAVTAFCQEVEGAGYYAGIYASESWFAQQLGEVSRYDRWVANWTGKPDVPHGIWQYSNAGRVDGIATPVDLDEAFQDYPAIIQAAGLNRPQEEAEALREQIAALQEKLLATTAQLTQVKAEKEDILRRIRALVEEYGETK